MNLQRFINRLSSFSRIIKIPTEKGYQTSEERNDKQRSFIIVLLVSVLKIKHLNPRINDQIQEKSA